MATSKGNMTPGRQRRKAQDQYFDVGKVGRKTGITLPDKGVRDENGLEPVSGIFSSPVASPQRNGSATLTSSDMHMQESSAPEVEQTIHMRKTPRLPPPRATTPKHTNIGSPKRMSTGRPHTTGKAIPTEEADGSPSRNLAKTQPPANRKLDFAGDNVRNSIERGDPFKPKNALRRSMGHAGPRRNIFASPEAPAKKAKPQQNGLAEKTLSEEPEEESEEEQRTEETVERTEAPRQIDDGPIMMEDDSHQSTPEETAASIEEVQQAEERHSSPARRKQGRPRKSIESVNDDSIQQAEEAQPPSAKRGPGRPRKSIESVNDSSLQQSAEKQLSSSKRGPGRPRKSIESVSDSSIQQSADKSSVNYSLLQHNPTTAKTTPGKKRDWASVEREHAEVRADMSQQWSLVADEEPAVKRKRGRPPKGIVHREESDDTIDPQLLAYGNDYMPDDGDQEESVQSRDEGVRFDKTMKIKRSKTAVPKERDPNRRMRATTSPVAGPSRGSQSPSKRGSSRAPPVSNVHLRATTPFEDAGDRVSRYGRAVIKPLQYWANESRVWKNGECEGIIRAEEVEKPKPKAKKRGRKAKKGISRLEDIDEGDSETESVIADEWEEELGVIAGPVAYWDPATQQSDAKSVMRDDIAFAAPSIITRDVAGSQFKYAKIMTMPFFGAGIVELPPAGFKRAKNSRKMQMCFFVHEGKVDVEVGAQGHGEANRFAISKGGVWVVPRGNNYAIMNESRTKTAKIFFAQGCEVEAAVPAPPAE